MLLLRRQALRGTRALSTTTKPWFRAAGEGTLILRFGNAIDEATNKKVLRRLDALGVAQGRDEATARRNAAVPARTPCTW